MTLEAFTAVALASAIWSLLCRVYRMDLKQTQRIVIGSHFFLAMCTFGGLVLPVEYGKACLAGGLAVFLFVAGRRWRNGQPDDVRRKPLASAPAPVPPAALERVQGGSKPPEQLP